MQPQFRAFNEHAPVHVHHRNLPHWQQSGSTYFVTFRLADSIPKTKVAQWNHERYLWLKAHGIDDHMTREQQAEAFSRINVKQRENHERQNARRLFSELDKSYGCCVLEKSECRRVVMESMQHFDGQRCHCGDYAIMPNHVHWIVQPLEGFKLGKILQSIKRFSSTQLQKQGLHEGTLWQSESYDRLIRDRIELDRTRAYIADNPGKAILKEGAYTCHVTAWLDA